MTKNLFVIVISAFLLFGCDNDDVRVIPDEMAITTNSETFEFAGLTWGMSCEEIGRIREIKNYKKECQLHSKYLGEGAVDILGFDIELALYRFTDKKLSEIIISFVGGPEKAFERCLLMEKMYGSFYKVYVNDVIQNDIKEKSIRSIESILKDDKKTPFKIRWKLDDGSVINYLGPSGDMIFFFSKQAWKTYQEQHKIEK